jgi:hypothetical protein
VPCGRKRSMVLGGPVPGIDRVRDPAQKKPPACAGGFCW